MKKGIQILIVVLLIVNLASVGLLSVQLSTASTRVDELYYILEYEMQNMEESMATSVSDAMLMTDYKVINMSYVIDGYDSKKHMMTGTVSFEIINDADASRFYVVVENMSTGKSKRFDAEALGNLKYTADIEVGYSSNYEYYIISEGEDGSVNMRSRTDTIETSALIHERGQLHVENSSWSKEAYTADGILFINQDIAKVIKIEVVVSGFCEDGHVMGEERRGDVLNTIDITDKLSPASELDYDVDIWSEVEYEKYAFRVASTLEDGAIDDYKSLLLSVIVHFEDETSLTMYQ